MQSCIQKVNNLTQNDAYWRYQYAVTATFNQLGRPRALYNLKLVNDELAELLTPKYAKITNNYLKEMLMLDVKLFTQYVGLNKTNQKRRMQEVNSLASQNNQQIQYFLNHFDKQSDWKSLFNQKTILWESLSKAIVSLNSS